MTDAWRASGIVAALEAVWKVIRARHPDTPSVVIVVASGTEDMASAKWGHWAAGRWKLKAGEAAGEVLIAGELFKEGAARTLSTLLHEAAHAIATARGVKDTSRGGRYHNERYKKIAEEVGLTVEKHPTIGWTLTKLAPGTAEAYADEIAAMGEAIAESYRIRIHIPRPPGGKKKGGSSGGDGDSDGDGESGDDGGEKKSGKRIKLVCMCAAPRAIWIAPSVAELGPIRCGACHKKFAPPGEDGEQAKKKPEYVVYTSTSRATIGTEDNAVNRFDANASTRDSRDGRPEHTTPTSTSARGPAPQQGHPGPFLALRLLRLLPDQRADFHPANRLHHIASAVELGQGLHDLTPVADEHHGAGLDDRVALAGDSSHTSQSAPSLSASR